MATGFIHGLVRKLIHLGSLANIIFNKQKSWKKNNNHNIASMLTKLFFKILQGFS